MSELTAIITIEGPDVKTRLDDLRAGFEDGMDDALAADVESTHTHEQVDDFGLIRVELSPTLPEMYLLEENRDGMAEDVNHAFVVGNSIPSLEGVDHEVYVDVDEGFCPHLETTTYRDTHPDGFVVEHTSCDTCHEVTEDGTVVEESA